MQSRDQVEKGLGKAGGMAKTRFGHDKQIDQGINAANTYLDNEAAKQQATPTVPTVQAVPTVPATPTSPPTVVNPDDTV